MERLGSQRFGDAQSNSHLGNCLECNAMARIGMVWRIVWREGDYTASSNEAPSFAASTDRALAKESNDEQQY
jgi:hypothetical protein